MSLYYKYFHVLVLLSQYNYHNSGHYPSSCLLFKAQFFRDRAMDNVQNCERYINLPLSQTYYLIYNLNVCVKGLRKLVKVG
jgi:hypothetical protein